MDAEHEMLPISADLCMLVMATDRALWCAGSRFVRIDEIVGLVYGMFHCMCCVWAGTCLGELPVSPGPVGWVGIGYRCSPRDDVMEYGWQAGFESVEHVADGGGARCALDDADDLEGLLRMCPYDEHGGVQTEAQMSADGMSNITSRACISLVQPSSGEP